MVSDMKSSRVNNLGKITAVLMLLFLFLIVNSETETFAEGRQFRFTVYYQDADGNELREPHMFYDSEGSKTVLECAEIPGYEPVVEKLTKTISSNDDENVFTFVYHKEEGVNIEEDEVPLASSETSVSKARDVSDAKKDAYDLDTKPPIAEPGKPMTRSEERSFSMILLLITCIAFAAAFLLYRHKTAVKKRK